MWVIAEWKLSAETSTNIVGGRGEGGGELNKFKRSNKYVLFVFYSIILECIIVLWMQIALHICGCPYFVRIFLLPINIFM
jgi:hypothetical protein